ncbi:hypothetical protein [Azospirillum sp. B510]|uniref:hypothetical protein n=1 Tax=Azospirillum sp. (strain B510) TaxID=137722 RepID=UPI0011D114CA|nr:hypothetical protein [Azospirillum sp. B510]
MRQACEISALREDLERLSHEAGILRDGVEQAVETVRDRFAALSAEEMADPMILAPLLQLAVTTLLEIREQARHLSTRTGPLPDDERPSWLGAADAPRLRQPASPAWNERWNDQEDEDDEDAGADGGMDGGAPALEPASSRPAEPPARPRQAALAAPVVPASPLAAPPSAPPSIRVTDHRSEGHASWLASEPAPVPPPSRAATARANGTGGARSPSGIDWLGPAGR